ncbi:MAG: DinB family protein [Chloroflexi bacterium]|nr:DinB family protein [Chloroflexota bacterium]
MDPVSLRDLYDHHAWSMDRLLARALEIPPERAAEVTRPDGLSLRDTLAHIVSAERNWLARWQRRDAYVRFRPDSVAGVSAGWLALQAEVRAFLAGLDPTDLNRPLARDPLPGDRGTLGAAILHVLMHGAQHTAEAAELLSRFGHSPGQLDYMEYLDERELAFPPAPPF